MAWTVVIAGGGFGGLYAARRLERRLPGHSARILLVTDANYMLYTPPLPGVARRLRLMADWTVGLLFGRAAAELGQLGHPPSPAAYLEHEGARAAEAVER